MKLKGKKLDLAQLGKAIVEIATGAKRTPKKAPRPAKKVSGKEVAG